MNTNSENITIDKLEYETLRRKNDEIKELMTSDFVIKVYRGAVLPPSQTGYYNNRVDIGLFSVDFTTLNKCSIQIEGKDYNIKSQNLFNKIKKLVSDNLDILISWSKNQTNRNLDNNAYDGGISRAIQIKYGQLIIYINGQVRDLSGKCDEFINDLKRLIITDGEKTDEDFIKENIDKTITTSQQSVDDDLNNGALYSEQIISNGEEKNKKELNKK